MELQPKSFSDRFKLWEGLRRETETDTWRRFVCNGEEPTWFLSTGVVRIGDTEEAERIDYAEGGVER